MPAPMVLLGCLEFLLLLAAVPAALILRFDHVFSLNDFLQLDPKTVLFAVIMLLANSAMGVYNNGFRDGFGPMLVRSLVAFCLLGVTALTLIYYVLPQAYLGRGVLAMATVFGMLFVSILRLVFYRVLDHEAVRSRLLVIGAGKRAKVLHDQLSSKTGVAKIVGFVSVGGYVDPALQANVIDSTSLQALVEQYELFDCKLKGTRINEAITVYERELGILEFTELKQGWMVFGGGFSGGKVWDVVKRVTDVLIALTLLAMLWPLMLLAVSSICSGRRCPCDASG